MKEVEFYALFLIFNYTVFGFNPLLLVEEESVPSQDCVSNFVLREFTENFPIYYIYDGNGSPIILHNDNNTQVIVNRRKPMKGLQFYSRYYILQAKNELLLDLIMEMFSIWNIDTSNFTKFLIIAPISRINLKSLRNAGVRNIAFFNYTNKIYTCDPYHQHNQCGQMCNYLVEHQCNTNKIRYETDNRSFKSCSIHFITPYTNNDVLPQNLITRLILREFANYLGLSINILKKFSPKSIDASLLLFFTHEDGDFHKSDSIFTDSFGWVTFVNKIRPTQILQYIFERKVWILIGVTFFSISIMWCLMVTITTNKRNVSTSFINVLALTLVGCMPSLPQMRPLKCLIFFYLVFVVIIHATFKTNLAQLLTADQYHSRIKSLKDLVDSDMPVCSSQYIIKRYFNQTIKEDSTYTKIQRKMRTNSISKYGNCTYLMFLQEIHALKHYNGDYKMDYFANNRLTGDLKYRFVVSKHNYFSERLNRFIRRFVENGIPEHIISKNNRKRYGYGKLKEEESQPKVLTMDHAYGIFVIWAVVMVTRQWCIIAFDDGVQIVPKNWIIGEDCFWPNFKSTLRYEKAVKNFENPEEDWCTYPVRILGTYSSYEIAKPKLKLAEEQSDLNSDNEQAKRNRKFKRKKYWQAVMMSNSITHNIEDGEYSSENEDISDGDMLPTIHRPLLSSTRPHHSKHQQALKNSTPSSRPSSSQSFTSDEDFKTKLLQQLSAIKVNLIKLNRRISLLENSKENVSKEDTIENETSKQYEEFISNIFPLQNEEDLVVVEVKLEEEPGFKVKLNQYCCRIGGHKTDEITKLMLRRLFSDKLASLYSWLGAKKKKVFCHLQLANVIINSVCTANKNTANCTEKDVVDSIKNWLRHASTRDKKNKHINMPPRSITVDESIHNLVEYFNKEKQNNGPLTPLTAVHARISDALKIDTKTISNALRRHQNQEENKENEPRQKSLKTKDMDQQQKSAKGSNKRI
ncbi:hypothetical protein FQA39_LY11172 [Lamprigera yunnana]|nr:hypothetical protein FQA39_LY11172 [Lamprigera yunnana]